MIEQTNEIFWTRILMSANNLDFKQTVFGANWNVFRLKGINLLRIERIKSYFFMKYMRQKWVTHFPSWHTLKALTETQYLHTGKPKECNL